MKEKCPHCGYCPTCGRTGQYWIKPFYPGTYPAYPFTWNYTTNTGNTSAKTTWTQEN